MPAPTPFHARTAALCGSHAWKDWAGFLAVRHFGAGLESEYHALRHAAGLLDVSPLFKYRVCGPDAGAFLAWVLCRDARRLQPGRVTYACFCDERGRVIDDGTVARLAQDVFRMTTASPSLSWLTERAAGFDVEVEDVSTLLAALAVQGPMSRGLLASLAGDAVRDLRFFGIAHARLAGVAIEVSRTGYTGDLGYEIWMDAGDALAVWDTLVEGGAAFGLLPVGLDALDVTRIEAGFILQGVDYHSALSAPIAARTATPFDVGLGWTVELDREPFIGQDALRSAARAPAWDLVGLEIDWEELEALYDAVGLPPHLPSQAWRTPLPVYRGRRQVGQATSGAWSPLLKRNLALATVRHGVGRPGGRLRIEQTVEYRRHRVAATVVARPFFDPERKRS